MGSHRRSLLWVGFTLTLQGSKRFQSRLPPKWQRRHTRMGWLPHIRSLLTRRLTSGPCSTITTMKGRQTCPNNGHARFTWDQKDLGLKIVQFCEKLVLGPLTWPPVQFFIKLCNRDHIWSFPYSATFVGNHEQ